jgi:hypothetical protein
MSGRLALLAAASVLLLPGCGEATEAGSSEPLDGLTAAQVLKKTQTAARNASSVHFVAHIVESGDEPVDLDVRIAGSNASGTIGTGGKTLNVRVIGESVYLQGDHQFWVDSVGPEVAKLLDGKWLKGSAADPKLKSITEMTSRESVADELLTPEGAVKRVKGRTVDGQETVGLHDKADSDEGTLYVANADKAYPLLVVPDPGSDSQGRAEFSDWDEKVTVTAPPAAQVVDVDKLDS